ncbi:MAG: methyltransferase domain-containing protein [Chloroflexi bacterium]|nr:methyltransferase domain-containing protein [Chloroflexota bacterium]
MGKTKVNRFQTDTAAYWSRWARFWDPMLRLVSLDQRYRKEAISMLDLRKEMTVLDIACGTGLNFPYLFEAVGDRGKIIAVDIAPGMLERARERARKNHWSNIEFITGDVSQIQLPEADAAAAFWCMVSIPNYRTALENIVSSLRPSGRLAILDFKPMDNFPGLLFNPIFRQICHLSHQNVERQPWRDMRGLLANVEMQEWKFGGMMLASVYLAWGEKS